MNDAVLASLEAVILSRAAERVLLVIVGALAVYLGYSLFRHMPNVNRAEGKMELPGGVSIFMSRIGPGVFFALFGCALIGYSVTKPVQFTLPSELGQAVVFSGLAPTQQPASPQHVAIAGSPEVTVARLNGFLAAARQTLGRPEADELEEAVRTAKYAVMLGRWNPEWATGRRLRVG